MKKILNDNKALTKFLLTGCILIISCFTGCKKLIEVDLPIDKTTTATVYNSASTTVAVLNGIYIKMAQGSPGYGAGGNGPSVLFGILSDELKPNQPDFFTGTLYSNSIVDDNTGIWSATYSELLLQVNSIIEGVTASTGIPEGSKKILLGEAKFLRALAYFNLVNSYGDVPLVLTTNYKVNTNIPRSPKAAVYEQIVKDLTDARLGLTDNYLGLNLSPTTADRLRPNKGAATALLARVYLYLNDWTKAEQFSSEVISNSLYSLPPLNEVFLSNSGEAIWQLQAILNLDDGLSITPDARYFLPYPGDEPKVSISDFLINAFEPGDARKDEWIRIVQSGGNDFPIPNKYKAGVDQVAFDPEYTMVLRLAEQYLIRAEARAQLGRITGASGAESDINQIRTRAGLPHTTAITSQQAMLDAILQERKVELFTEWGHRWYDLKRTNKMNAVMSVITPLKGGTWDAYKALLPIPKEEFTTNAALKGHQNPGYPQF